MSFKAKRKISLYASELLPPFGRLDDDRQKLWYDREYLLENKHELPIFASEKRKRINN